MQESKSTGEVQIVRIKKRRNPLAIVMAVIFGVLGLSALATTSAFWGCFLLVCAVVFTFVKEDAER